MAALLRLQHRRFRVAQQAARLVAVLREQADPDGRGHVELRPTRPERRSRGNPGCAAPPSRPEPPPPSTFVTLALEVREQQQERVARAPGHQIRLSRRLAEPARHHVQDLVSGEPPERVVHQPEIVDVDADHRHGGLVMPRTGQFDSSRNSSNIDRLGRPVNSSWYVRNATFSSPSLDLGDVDHHAEREGRNPSLVAEHLRFVVDPYDAAVLAIRRDSRARTSRPSRYGAGSQRPLGRGRRGAAILEPDRASFIHSCGV